MTDETNAQGPLPEPTDVTTRERLPEQRAPLPETEAPVGEPVVEQPPPSRRLRRKQPRRQSAFRRWRKTRPFWGGVFTMLGGIEIAGLTAMSYQLILISKSVGFAVAVGAAIAAFGLTMWLSPALSKLLGLLTLVAAMLSFVTANLGGFLLGMIFAIIGGGLSFAWEPGRAEVEPTEAVEETAEPDAPPEAVAVGIPEQRPSALDAMFEPDEP